MEHRLIYLVRHGEIQGVGKKCFIGQTDLPLSNEGIKQAYFLQRELCCMPISGIFCSDLKRTLNTAQIVAAKGNIAITPLKELREIDLGQWEGKSFEEVRRLYPREFKKRGEDMVNYRPSGGESFSDLRDRVMKAFNNICQNTKGNIIIVGHAGVNRVILCSLMDIPLNKMFTLCQDYGCLNIIAQGNFGFKVRLLNKIYRILPK
ncbi:alpha-ribazole phosphatase [Peptococcaceae bacterium 1198_IL3148]